MIDARAERALKAMFWSSKGWKNPPEPPDAEELAHARRVGAMFEPLTLDHDEVVARVVAARTLVTERAAADAFLASLSTRRVAWRSALASRAVARDFPTHAGPPTGRCSICGAYVIERNVDRDVMSFERLRWGGVRRDGPEYLMFDLETFEVLDARPPVADDVALLRRALAALEALPPKTTATQAEKALAFLPSSKDEREVLIDVLGVASVLAVPGRPTYEAGFVAAVDRAETGKHFDERAYPTRFWKASDGLDHAVIARLFPSLAG